MTMATMTRFGVRYLGSTALVVLFAVSAAAQDPLVRGDATQQIAPHVYAIPDGNVGLVPNVGIVVGETATLVIDTGLGPRNGETIRQVVDSLTYVETLYVVTTHYHPEHSLGFAGLGDNAQLVMPRVQQDEMRDGNGIRDRFAERSALTADLLRGVEYPVADMLFDDEITLDLGGLTARVFTTGPLHTLGDTIVWIPEEGVLFSGDVVMQNRFPAFAGADGSVSRWLEVLDTLEALEPMVVVGAHTEFGDSAMITAWSEYFGTLQQRVRALKAEGQTAEAVADTLVAEFAERYPDWTGPNRVQGAALAAYRELP